MQSFNLFPTSDRQTLETDKLNINLDNKQIKKDIVNSFQMLSSTYSVDKEYLTEVFKIIVNKIEESKDDSLKDELAAYLVKNLNSEVNK